MVPLCWATVGMQARSVTRVDVIGWQGWQEQVAATCISRLHRDVSEVLAAMGLPHENEGVTDDHLFSVDIMLRTPRIAVEVDGPFHFTTNTHRPLGARQARSRCPPIPPPHLAQSVRGWLVHALTIHLSCASVVRPPFEAFDF